jgi:hypothetical protein
VVDEDRRLDLRHVLRLGRATIERGSRCEIRAQQNGQCIGHATAVAKTGCGDLSRTVRERFSNFFFGYPSDEPGLRFIHGSDVAQAVITDKKKGRPHSIRYNVRACRAYGLTTPEIWWGSVLAFDALIGNTDRHPDNWGLLVRLEVDADPQHAMAPAFDNGTSLAYELAEDRLPDPKDQTWFDRYVGRGTHHAGWTLRNNEPSGHFDMCTTFIKAFNAAGAGMRNVILCNESHTSAVLNACTGISAPLALSERRADFLRVLLATRRRNLERALS